MSPRLRVGGGSDVGLHRHNNQDSMYAGPRLIAVADGVGGAAGGEVASRLTITALIPLDSEPVDDPEIALRRAAADADVSIRETVAGDPTLSGMSTTLTAILATGDQLVLAHIGDSRAYRLRGGVLSQLTRDHTLVQSLIDEGQITEEEALTHPRRSWIMRALDGRGQPDLDLSAIDVEPGDRYLVCSDGLSSYVSEADITAGLAGDEPQLAADRLIDLALRAGGPDNVSCVVADPVDGDLAEQPPILGGAIAEPIPEPRPRETAPPQPTPPPPADDDAPVARRSIGRRLTAVAAVVVILIGAGVAGLAIYIHHQFYIAPSAGKVAVFQGVQGSAAGIQLSHLHALTNIPVTALPQDDKANVANGIKASGGQSGASSVVSNLRSQACALATPTPTPAPTTSAKSAKRSTTITTPPTPAVWCASAP
jgi:PPM family protein phosphatase